MQFDGGDDRLRTFSLKILLFNDLATMTKGEKPEGFVFCFVSNDHFAILLSRLFCLYVAIFSHTTDQLLLFRPFRKLEFMLMLSVRFSCLQ